jgi:hypothetical protein
MPAKKYVQPGTNGETLCHKCYAKHSECHRSLKACPTSDIKDLDTPVNMNGKPITLRKLMLSLPWPLGDTSINMSDAKVSSMR